MCKTISQRMYWRFLRTLGLKQLSWDKQFEAGAWHRPAHDAEAIARIAPLCGGGRIVAFGCGESTLPMLLPRSSFSDYIGYDISEVAIQKARQWCDMAGLERCHFEQCDMAKWEGLSNVSLVVAEECIYYLKPSEIEHFLHRCCRSLTPEGSILVVVHCAAKHAKTLDLCTRVCKLQDRSLIGSQTFLTLAPKSAHHRKSPARPVSTSH